MGSSYLRGGGASFSMLNTSISSKVAEQAAKANNMKGLTSGGANFGSCHNLSGLHYAPYLTSNLTQQS